MGAALATTALPVALGLLAGIWLGPTPRRASSLALIAVGLLATHLWPALPPGEVLWTALGWGAGLWLGSAPSLPTGVQRGISLGLFAMSVELLSWIAGPSTSPMTRDDRRAWIPLTSLSPRCTWASATEGFAAATDPSTPLVIHLGDSMIDQFDVSREEAVVAQLDRLDPHAHHVEAGQAGSGPDCAWRVMRDGPDAALWVLHTYLGNDIEDLKGGYAWCADRSLTDRQLPPTLRCDRLPRALSPSARLATAVPPVALRQIAPHSHAARLLAVGIEAGVRRHQQRRAIARVPKHGGLEPVYHAVLDAMHAEAQARGGALRVVLTPLRAGHPPPVDETAERLLRRAADGPLSVIDGRAALDPHDPTLFLDGDDPHPSATGHARWAAWLHKRRVAQPTAAAPAAP